MACPSGRGLAMKGRVRGPMIESPMMPSLAEYFGSSVDRIK